MKLQPSPREKTERNFEANAWTGAKCDQSVRSMERQGRRRAERVAAGKCRDCGADANGSQVRQVPGDRGGVADANGGNGNERNTFTEFTAALECTDSPDTASPSAGAAAADRRGYRTART